MSRVSHHPTISTHTSRLSSGARLETNVESLQHEVISRCTQLDGKLSRDASQDGACPVSLTALTNLRTTDSKAPHLPGLELR